MEGAHKINGHDTMNADHLLLQQSDKLCCSDSSSRSVHAEYGWLALVVPFRPARRLVAAPCLAGAGESLNQFY